MGNNYLSLQGLIMNLPSVTTGSAVFFNGIKSNGQDQDDSTLPANTQHAGGTFRSRAPEDQQRSLPVGNRASSAVLAAHNYMNPQPDGSETGHSSMARFTVGSDDENSDDNYSPLSSLSSNPGSEPADLRGLEQALENLAVERSGSTEGAVGGRPYGYNQILENLTLKLNKLASLSSPGRGGDDKAVDNARKKLGQMITDSITTARVEDWHEVACGIQSWQKANGSLLKKCGVKPSDPEIPDLIAQAMVPIKFDDFITGIANTGVMTDLSEGVWQIDTYLNGYDVTIQGLPSFCTDMGKEVHMPLLSLSFYRENVLASRYPGDLLDGDELPDFTYLLDGNKNKDWNHLARELDAYFQPIFQWVREAGGSVPAGTLEEHLKSVSD